MAAASCRCCPTPGPTCCLCVNNKHLTCILHWLDFHLIPYNFFFYHQKARSCSLSLCLSLSSCVSLYVFLSLSITSAYLLVTEFEAFTQHTNWEKINVYFLVIPYISVCTVICVLKYKYRSKAAKQASIQYAFSSCPPPSPQHTHTIDI